MDELRVLLVVYEYRWWAVETAMVITRFDVR